MHWQTQMATAGAYRQTFPICRHARLCGASLQAASAAINGGRPRECVLIDWSSTAVEYTQGWDLQKRCLQRVRQFAEQGAVGHDYLIILQHQPSFTLGAGSTEANLHFDISAPPLPVHRVERGGEVTYHGPGQLVLYPILDLQVSFRILPGATVVPMEQSSVTWDFAWSVWGVNTNFSLFLGSQYHTKDLHWYLRTLEEVAIRALWEVSGLHGQRIEGLTGVWVDGCKVAAIGVRAQRWITYHGLALNIDMDLAPFDMIVPCGISDRRVSMVSHMVQRQHGTSASLARTELLGEYLFSLQQSFAEVFGVELVSEGPDIAETIGSLELQRM